MATQTPAAPSADLPQPEPPPSRSPYASLPSWFCCKKYEDMARRQGDINHATLAYRARPNSPIMN